MIAFENGTKELTRTTEKKRDRRRTVKYVPTARISENLLLTRVHLKRVEEVYIQMVHGAWYIELMIISIALDAII